MALKFNTTTGKIIAKRFTQKQLEGANRDQAGYCRACGNRQDGVEPDARKYKCEGCGRDQVYGAEELMMMCVG